MTRAQPLRASEVVPGAESLMCGLRERGAYVPGANPAVIRR